MKRPLLEWAESEPPAARVHVHGPHPDYIPLTQGNYDFEIHEGASGKMVVATQAMPADADILVEVPLVCWPTSTSASSWDTVAFCEHCLAFQSNEGQTGTTAPSNEGLPCNDSFCGVTCWTAATEGWFGLMGGHSGLRRLREFDWDRPDGDGSTKKSRCPITLEAIGRVLCTIAARYRRLETIIGGGAEKNALSQDMTQSILADAVRPFERLVTPAQADDPSRLLHMRLRQWASRL